MIGKMNRLDFSEKLLGVLLLILIALILGGCAGGGLASSPEGQGNTEVQAASPAAVTAAATEPENPAVLAWQGQTMMGEDGPSLCSRLELEAGKDARLGECDAPLQTKSLFANRDQEWAEIQARFAPFEYQSATDQLSFHGQGSLAGPAWERALLSWVHFTYGELSAGRVSSSVRTRLSWVIAPLAGQPERCAHLVVLSFGYAVADTIPCAGGDAQDSQGGWLEPAEMEAFDGWLYGLQSYSEGLNYLEGEGTQAAGAQTVEEMHQWAAHVFERLSGKPVDELATATPAAATPAAGGPLEMVEVVYAGVEVGVGSPIPVTLIVDGNFPNTCSQIAEIQQDLQGFDLQTFVFIRTNEAENCRVDSLPFRMSIPLNGVGLAEGTYTVTVNGQPTTFEVPLAPNVDVN